MNLEEKKQAEEEAKRQRKEEILPKVKVLAESIPTYKAFEKRLNADIGVVRDARTQAAISRVVKRQYGEELAQQQKNWPSSSKRKRTSSTKSISYNR
jgi:hypothetical protein